MTTDSALTGLTSELVSPWPATPHCRHHYAAEHCGVRPDEALLVAAHPWDIDGAQRAGLAGAWLRRGVPDTAYPHSLANPSLATEDLTELARIIG
ncbi:HAD family hydrolase [Streptomyces dysideae]|uniref:hypothetical protein n=1 Tax=Streptomyces dysideae TaxID=909626 RepID=UPI000A755AD7|nr:hypothetical protein [Streptomyces dysideae]